MTYHLICSMSKTTGAASGVDIGYPFVASEVVTPDLSRFHTSQSSFLCSVI